MSSKSSFDESTNLLKGKTLSSKQEQTPENDNLMPKKGSMVEVFSEEKQKESKKETHENLQGMNQTMIREQDENE